MKGFITLSLVLIGMSTFARVGTEWFSHKVTADTEEEVIQKAEDTIPLILSGKVRSVFQDGCWPNNSRTIKITNVSTRKAYKYVDDELVPYYIATIKYLHRRCRD